MKGLALFISILSGLLPVSGQLLTIPFTAENLAGDLAGISTDSRVTTPLISRGSGLDIVVEFPGYYDSSGWSTEAAFPGIGSGSYLSLSFVVENGYQWIPDSLFISYQDAGSAFSPRSLELRQAADSFASVLFTDTSVVSFPNGNDVNIIDLSSLGPMTGTVEFRLYGYGAISANGVLGLANDPALNQGGEDRAVLVAGTVELVPEPGFSILFLGLAVFLVRILRRRI